MTPQQDHMAVFRTLLDTVHLEVWDAGTEARPELDAMLAELLGARLPQGVVRLPTSSMRSGPHLAAQERGKGASVDVITI